MIKKLLRASVALITVFSLSMSTFAASYVTNDVKTYYGSLASYQYSKTSKKFTSETGKNSTGNVYEITVGLSVLNYKTGSTIDEDFARKYNTRKASVDCYASYGTVNDVSVYGSHSAYNNGKCTFFAYTDAIYAM